MVRRPTRGRRLIKHQPLAFSPFMRSLAFAASSSTAKNKMSYSQAKKKLEKETSEKGFSKQPLKEKNEESSESSDGEDTEVQVEFDFSAPNPEDFHAVKILLQNYLNDNQWDLSGFVDLILDQDGVGTVIKVGDDGLFCIVTAVNLGRYKDRKCIMEIKDFLIKVCPEKNLISGLRSLLEDKAKDVGLLVSQRVVNLPPQLLPPLYDFLFDEVSKATENSLRFKYYLLATKIYKLKNAEQRKKTREDADEEIIFYNPEDEIFLMLSTWSFTFPLHNQVTPQELRNYRLMGLVMVVEADKIPEFRQQLKSLIDEP